MRIGIISAAARRLKPLPFMRWNGTGYRAGSRCRPEMVKRNLTCRPCVFPETFRPADYRIFSGGPQHLLHDGDGLDLGGRKLSVVHTPGHSPGHCCFYEEERGYLFSGDLLYVGKLDAFYPTTDPRRFWRSVQKVRKLEFSRILPVIIRWISRQALPTRSSARFPNWRNRECWSRGTASSISGRFGFISEADASVFGIGPLIFCENSGLILGNLLEEAV